jgi:hypothetical protein
MTINLIRMILKNTPAGIFNGLVINDQGEELDSVMSLDRLIMAYATARNGGTSELVSLPLGIEHTEVKA